VTRPLPPYGRVIAATLQQPERLVRFAGCTRDRASVWLATGPDAWDWKKAHPKHLTLVLPFDANPDDLRWDFLRGHEPVLLIGSDEKDTVRRREIAAAMFRDGIQKVLAGRVLMTQKVSA